MLVYTVKELTAKSVGCALPKYVTPSRALRNPLEEPAALIIMSVCFLSPSITY
jgi:hypothetical protein